MPLQRMEFQPPQSPWQDILVSALKQYQNSAYELPLKQAMAYSKAMYGMNLYPSQLERIMRDPVALSQLDPNVRDLMVEQYQNYIRSQGRSMGQIVPSPNYIPQYNQGAQPVAPGQLGKIPYNNYVYDSQGNNVRASQEDINRAAGAPPDAVEPTPVISGTPASNLEATPMKEGPDSNNPDYSGEMTSSQYRAWAHKAAQEEAKDFNASLSPRQQRLEETLAAKNKMPSYEGAVAETKEQKKKEQEQWADFEKERHDAAQSGELMQSALAKFYTNSKKLEKRGFFTDLLQQGPIGGRLPSYTKERDIMEQSTGEAVAMAGKSLQAGGNRVTNMDFQLGERMKVAPHLTKGARASLSKSLSAYSQRAKDEEDMATYFRERKVPLDVARVLIKSYKDQNPVFDNDIDKINKGNLGPKSWRDYATQKAINEVITKGSFSLPGKQKRTFFKEEPPAEAIESTARKYGMSVEQVREQLGLD